MIKYKLLSKSIIMVVLWMVSNSSYAISVGLEGKDVQFAVYCCSAPTEPNRISDILNAVVGSEVEFSSIGTSGASVIGADIDISNTRIEADYTVFSTSSNGTFNGWVFDFGPINTVPEIIGLSLDPITTFSSDVVDLTFDENTIRISLPGQPITPDSFIAVDVSFAPVPLPGAVLLFGSGLLGLMGIRKKIKIVNISV
jgi:hypothetical protein